MLTVIGGANEFVFGRLTDGMNVVEKIAAVPVENERPRERVDIYSMKVERRK